MPQPPPDQLLRSAGLHVTGQRIAVLNALRAQPHATADDVAGRARKALGAISTQAVYDALGTLADAGLVRKIQHAGSAARYETRVGDNHHHLICRDCGAIHDVECAIGEAPCITASEDHGFQVDEAEVVYWGRCPDCQIRPTASASSPAMSRHDRRHGKRSIEENQ